MKIAKILGYITATGLAVCLGAGLWFNHAYNGMRAMPDSKAMMITPGSPVNKIAAELHEQGIIGSPIAFKIGARYHQILHPERSALKAGEYALPAAASTRDILRILRAGDTLQRRITIPEGLMAIEIVELINRAEGLTGEIIDIPAEGSLLPETYHYTRGSDRNELIARLQKSMETSIQQLWEKRAENLPFSTIEEAVTLASIVEKETAIAAERPRVAGVFVNRLRKDMKLQTDPTVIYALTEGKTRLNRPLTRADLLRTKSPYNTYYVKGLPPGPIANPGYASLSATLNPEENDYFYFVADGTGGHTFAATHIQHVRNVQQWRKFQRAQKNAPAASPAEDEGGVQDEELLDETGDPTGAE